MHSYDRGTAEQDAWDVMIAGAFWPKKEKPMSKLTKDELVEMKAVGYIEGNSATIPDALKVGQELHDKIVQHDAAFVRKQARQHHDDKAD